MAVVWASAFDNRRRHCWRDKYGNHHIEGNFDMLCDGDHDKKLIGKVEWMRFIHAFQEICDIDMKPSTREGNPFIDIAGDPNKALVIDSNHVYATPDGMFPFAENYMMRTNSESGWKFIMSVMLDNDNGKARIECYDENMKYACEKAMEIVKKSYE